MGLMVLHDLVGAANQSCCYAMQATPLGQGSLQISVPDGLLLDDQGGSITEATVSPTDILTALIAIAAATIDLRSNHTNFTLNNMIACLVATDILQV